MSVLTSIRSQLVPIHREGYPFIGLFALVTFILFFISGSLGWIGTLLTLWCATFFRDPERVTPLRDGLVIAPADGVVSAIVNVVPPRELDLGEPTMQRISVFMSVFDCHINRSPIGGRIEKIVYREGTFINADLDKASEENERNAFVIATGRETVAVVQIAGLIARRIVSFVQEGTSVRAGERIGMIRFGSRVDVYLPREARSLVSEGQTAIAGETVLADLRAAPGELSFRVS